MWRADDGYVNVWENRCLHRGVRLSIGINDGRELKCQYHGWRYSNRTAGCTYIPAHPADAPARTITNRTYPAVERYGLVWSTEEPEARSRRSPASTTASLLVLRGIAGQRAGRARGRRSLRPVSLPAERRHRPATARRSRSRRTEGFSVALRSRARMPTRRLPCSSSSRSIPAARSFAACSTARPPAATASPSFAITTSGCRRCATLVERRGGGRAGAGADRARLRAGLARACRDAGTADARPQGRPARRGRAQMAGGATASPASSCKPVKGLLPTFQPGAHIDVHMPNGQIRQYSITNGPGESGSYVIGVKREPDSKGGSICMHDTVREGDVLAISEPRNNFPLRRDAIKTLFVAGGIGITPLLAMAQALAPFRAAARAALFRAERGASRLSRPARRAEGHAGPASRPRRRQQTGAKLARAAVGLPSRHACLSVRPRPDAGGRAADRGRTGLARRSRAFRIFQEHQDDRRQFELRGGAGALLR